MTNFVPQTGPNNEGPWADFENYCRSLAQAGSEIYIVSGPAGNAGTIDSGRIVVPTVTWKVVLIIPNGNNDLQRVNKATRAFGIIVPNVPPPVQSSPWRQYRVTVDAVENLTGYNFFNLIPINTQTLIERKRDRL
jgi:endonuclease G